MTDHGTEEQNEGLPPGQMINMSVSVPGEPTIGVIMLVSDSALQSAQHLDHIIELAVMDMARKMIRTRLINNHGVCPEEGCRLPRLGRGEKCQPHTTQDRMMREQQ